MNMNSVTPFRGQATLQDQINRMFNDAFERTERESNLTSWAPAVDIYENEHELVVNADLPGVEAKDLDIRIENNTITIRGERKFEQETKEENFHRVERRYGSFQRSFGLPPPSPIPARGAWGLPLSLPGPLAGPPCCFT